VEQVEFVGICVIIMRTPSSVWSVENGGSTGLLNRLLYPLEIFEASEVSGTDKQRQAHRLSAIEVSANVELSFFMQQCLIPTAEPLSH
jgi:hypothetical protein